MLKEKIPKILIVAAGLLLGAASGWLPAPAGAADETAKVKIIIGKSIGPYEQVLKSIQAAMPSDVKTLTLTGETEEDRQAVRALQPETTSAVVAIGSPALARVTDLDQRLPIVFTMVYENLDLPGRRVSGVAMQIPVETQIQYLRKLFPERKSIGVLYDPKYSQKLINQIRDVSPKYDFSLIALQVVAAGALPDIAGKLSDSSADLMWIVPDVTVANPQAVKLLVDISLKKKVPLIGLSLFHVQNQATVALSVDYEDIGRQTAEQVRTLLAGQDPEIVPPRKVVIFVNKEIQQQLGLKNMVVLPEMKYF